MATTDKKPVYINRGYGKEKLCKHCDDYYPMNEDFFYRLSPSSQSKYVISYENICIPCYNYRKAQYRAKAKLKKEQTNVIS